MVNYKQVLAIAIAVLGVLAVSSANLQDLFGQAIAKYITSAANLLTTLLAAVLANYTSTSQSVIDTGNIKGVEVQVSRDAPQQIAALAVDESQQSVSPAPGEERAVVKKAVEGTDVA